MASAVRCKLLLYADDSALIASGKNVADIESTLSSELEYVSNWLIDNKLSLHLGKTRSILFGTKRRLSTGVKLNVICNGNVIESKSNVTYLGVTLDQFLSGEIIASNFYIIREESPIFAPQRLRFKMALGVAANTIGKVIALTVFMCVCSTFRPSDFLLFVKNGFVVGVRCQGNR